MMNGSAVPAAVLCHPAAGERASERMREVAASYCVLHNSTLGFFPMRISYCSHVGNAIEAQVRLAGAWVPRRII